MKNQQLVITAKDGIVVIQSKKAPEFGYLRLQEESGSFNMEGGWVKEVKALSAILRGKYDVLLKMNFKEGAKIGGQILRMETIVKPTKPDAQPLINPTTKAVVTHNGAPVYSDNIYTSSSTKESVILSHDKIATPAQLEVATVSQKEATAN